MMEERKIKLATIALLTPVKEVLDDVVIPSFLADVNEEYGNIIRKADELLKFGKPAVTGRSCLESIFNVLNGNNEKMIYLTSRLDGQNIEINYPVSQTFDDQTDFRKKASKKEFVQFDFKLSI